MLVPCPADRRPVSIGLAYETRVNPLALSYPGAPLGSIPFNAKVLDDLIWRPTPLTSCRTCWGRGEHRRPLNRGVHVPTWAHFPRVFPGSSVRTLVTFRKAICRCTESGSISRNPIPSPLNDPGLEKTLPDHVMVEVISLPFILNFDVQNMRDVPIDVGDRLGKIRYYFLILQ